MNTVPRENGSKPFIAAMIGSVIAIRSRGTRYACQPVRFAPANRLIAPTGARFGGCGSTRNTAPIVVKLNAGHLEGAFIAFNPLLLYQTPPDWAPIALRERRAGGLPIGSRRKKHRSD